MDRLWPSAGPCRFPQWFTQYNCQEETFSGAGCSFPTLLPLEDLYMSIPWDSSPALSTLKEIAWKIELTQHLHSAGLVILIYDYFLTVSDEIRYIWPSKWTLVKIAFLMNRYITPVCLITSLIIVTAFTFDVPSCRRGVFAATALNALVSASWNVILAVRVYAFWGARRSIGMTLGIGFACTATATVIATVTYASRIARAVVVIKDLNVCIPKEMPRSYYVIWFPGLMFETVVFLMTMYKVVGPVKGDVHSIASLILRDGVMYFVTMLGARVANMSLFIHRDPGLAYSCTFLLLGLGSTLVSRITLNFRTWRTDGAESPPVYVRRRVSLSRRPHATGDRNIIPTLDTGTGPSAGKKLNHVYSGGRPYVSGSDAREPTDDFIVPGSKHDIPLKNVDFKG